MEDAASLEREGRELLERAATAAELEDARDMTRAQALELLEDGGLAAQALAELRGVEAGRDELHGDVGVRLAVAGAKNGRKPA